MFVGDYHYGSVVIDDQRYAVIWNGPALEGIRKILPDGNPIVWQAGDPLTDLMLAIMAQT